MTYKGVRGIMTYKQVDSLRECRVTVAALIRDIARRKLDRAKVRAEVVATLIAAGRTKTDADKEHMTDPRMVAFDRETVELEYGVALAEADAEAARFELEYEIAASKTVGVQ